MSMSRRTRYGPRRPQRRPEQETKPCPDCHGMGVVTNRNGVVVYCPKCKGRRRVPK